MCAPVMDCAKYTQTMNEKKNSATTTDPFFDCISLLGKLNGFLCFFSFTVTSIAFLRNKCNTISDKIVNVCSPYMGV